MIEVSDPPGLTPHNTSKAFRVGWVKARFCGPRPNNARHTEPMLGLAVLDPTYNLIVQE